MPKNITQLRIDGLTALQLAELRAAVTATASDYFTTVDSPKLTIFVAICVPYWKKIAQEQKNRRQ